MNIKPPKPMLAEVARDNYFNNKNWVSERKFDGFRAVAVKKGGIVRIFSRNGKEYSDNFKETAWDVK